MQIRPTAFAAKFGPPPDQSSKTYPTRPCTPKDIAVAYAPELIRSSQAENLRWLGLWRACSAVWVALAGSSRTERRTTASMLRRVRTRPGARRAPYIAQSAFRNDALANCGVAVPMFSSIGHTSAELGRTCPNPVPTSVELGPTSVGPYLGRIGPDWGQKDQH